MSSHPNEPGFDTSRAAALERRFRFSRTFRKYKEEGRELNAKIKEEKKRLPDVINKLCPYPLNPDLDCFAMTLETDITRRNETPLPIIITDTEPKVPADDEPQCLAIKSELFVKRGKTIEALRFYKAAFGAEVMTKRFLRKRKANQGLAPISGIELKIGSDIILLSGLKDESSPPRSFFSMSTTDVESAVDKVVKAGATVLGKPVQVYSNCQIWCSMVKLNDPYGNLWIIYNKLCASCLQSFLLLA
ncbi:VOC domain-containing protein [Heracleum sosnowskyi]|uniref:VOC domain-containing protein n=1 Tax=Heracleum sosnowskyi TaxID=360622 RepID=A0AAD8MTS6_9APIA|nr:VOC domain-containing protein [Heracleum sosnowskyi]